MAEEIFSPETGTLVPIGQLRIEGQTKDFKISKENVHCFFKEVSEQYDLFIAENVYEPFDGQIIPKFDGFVTDSYSPVVDGVSHRTVIEESKDKGVHKLYNYFEGISIIKNFVKKGMNKNNTNAHVYVLINEKLHRLSLITDSQSKLVIVVLQLNMGHLLLIGSHVFMEKQEEN
ncbi:MAG: hypothetical protein NTZ44_03370 [Candidatus Nomurabacteria bacterium]|nr:hypothetical protein [Candidatus Nomurabacteria bacterium]